MQSRGLSVSACSIAGVDLLLCAVLGSSEVSAALEDAGVSSKQLVSAVEELRGTSAKVCDKTSLSW